MTMCLSAGILIVGMLAVICICVVEMFDDCENDDDEE